MSGMRKKPVMGTCRLCLCHSQLVQSHVIPEFFFKPLKEKDGHFFIQCSDPAKKELKQQKAPTENLLCLKCDTVRLQKNEDHLSRILYQANNLKIIDAERFLAVTGYDYDRIRKGLLSILWRMSISQNPFFKNVNLGDRHEEILRRLRCPRIDGHELSH